MDLQKRPEQAQTQAPATGLRASDADRDRAADILREALSEGRLTAEEHSERVEGVYRAKTFGEIEPYVADLPAPAAERPTRARPGAYEPPAPSGPVAPEETMVAVLSTTQRKGRWRVARSSRVYAIFGTVSLDLSEALFEYQHVTIKAYAVFGNVEIRVPENVSLRGNGIGVLGNFKVDVLDSAEPEAPVVFVDGVTVLGNIEAKPRRGRVISDLRDMLRKRFDL
ncbi:DUF1707 domain-containing protein [Streptomyces sp. NPDC050560]|uniref:DUF1707 SHOCT-like domain-containing protein n=1 Tax=Streptomyces sp. NPDC050560 TaxID=3365630 RepID=UPI00379E155E